MAIHSSETGIVDYAQVTKSYASNFVQSGGKIHTNYTVIKFQRATEGSEYPVLIFNNRGKVSRLLYLFNLTKQCSIVSIPLVFQLLCLFQSLFNLSFLLAPLTNIISHLNVHIYIYPICSCRYLHSLCLN